MNLPLIAERLFGRPLAAEPGALAALLDGLGGRLGHPGAHLPLLPLAAETGRAAGKRKPACMIGTTAVIPIIGKLVHRGGGGGGIDAFSDPLTSYQSIRSEVQTALDDPGTAAILLEVDSGGGEADGCAALATDIRRAAAAKPLWAAVNESAYSAAMWLTSAASRVTITRTGGAGSIGVIAMHVDRSRALDAKGLTYTAVTAGARKADLTDSRPLSDDGRATLQRAVDACYGAFVEAVSGFRSLSPDAVRGQEAGLFFGPEALAAGLVDAVQPFDQTVAELAEFSRTGSQTGLRSGHTSVRAHKEPSVDNPDISPAVAARASQIESDARSAERARLKAIMTSDGAAGRTEAALSLATETDMPAAAVIALLGTLPKAPPAATAAAPDGGFAAAMARQGNPQIAPAADQEQAATDLRAFTAATIKQMYGQQMFGGK